MARGFLWRASLALAMGGWCGCSVPAYQQGNLVKARIDLRRSSVFGDPGRMTALVEPGSAVLGGAPTGCTACR